METNDTMGCSEVVCGGGKDKDRDNNVDAVDDSVVAVLLSVFSVVFGVCSDVDDVVSVSGMLVSVLVPLSKLTVCLCFKMDLIVVPDDLLELCVVLILNFLVALLFVLTSVSDKDSVSLLFSVLLSLSELLSVDSESVFEVFLCLFFLMCFWVCTGFRLGVCLALAIDLDGEKLELSSVDANRTFRGRPRFFLTTVVCSSVGLDTGVSVEMVGAASSMSISITSRAV